MTKKPASFTVFMIVLSMIILAFITASAFSYYRVDKKYSLILGCIMFVSLAFSMVGIYAGFRYKAAEGNAKLLNRVGVIGNLLILSFVMIMMIASILK